MQRRQRAQQHAGHQPSPAASLPDEFVWKLLLQELWAQPEAAVVCKLLCCSNAMAQLVHTTCAGRVKVMLLDRPAVAAARRRSSSYSPALKAVVAATVAAIAAAPPSCLSGPTLGRWLAKHASLLQGLAVQLAPGMEDGMAAGMQLHHAAAGAAAHAAPSTAGRRTTRAAAAAAATAAAVLSLPAPELQQGALTTSPAGLEPRGLSALLLQGASSGQLLHVMCGSTQLTRLQITLAAGLPVHNVRHSLASLIGLKDLRLEVSCNSSSGSAEQQKAANQAARQAEELLPALQQLSQLTALHLQPGCLRGRNCRFLPRSLRSLTADKDTYIPVGAAGGAAAAAAGAPLDLNHLSDLTRLSCTAVSSNGSLTSHDVLPPSLIELHALVDRSFSPVLKLQSLQRLDCNWPIVPRDVQQLRQLSNLQDLRLTAQHAQLERAADLIGELPLKQLTFDVPGEPQLNNLLSNMHHWTRLENVFLMVQPRSVPFAFTSLAGKLQKLPALRTLAIACRGDPQRTVGVLSPAEWGSFVQDMRGMKSLQTLMLCQVQLGEAVAQLGVVSQLTRLALVRCGVGDAAKAEMVEKLGAACVRVLADTIIDGSD